LLGFGTDEFEPEEPMKRLTIDVPVELHRRIKAALRQTWAEDVERAARSAGAQIPETSGQFRLPL
jgi:hypothetical protein